MKKITKHKLVWHKVEILGGSKENQTNKDNLFLDATIFIKQTLNGDFKPSVSS